VQVDVPRFESKPADGVASVGNEAIVRASGGLIALLEAPLTGDASTIGAGYQAPLTVPFGLAVTSALGALGAADPQQDRWMVRSAAIDWQSRAQRDDVITAQARVDRMTEHDAFVAATARGSVSGPLLRASVRVVGLRGGRYAAMPGQRLPAAQSAVQHDRSAARANTAADNEPPLLRLRPPRIAMRGARTELAFEPDLLRFLMCPVAGHDTPLGRRVHPLGGAPLGAALTTALAAAGEQDPDRPTVARIVRTEVTWLLPLVMHSPWTARTRQQGSDDPSKAFVDVIGADTRTALQAVVAWAAVDR
jgi:hypothetical protein